MITNDYVNVERLKELLIELHSRYRPLLAERGEENFRAVRNELVRTISPELGQMIFDISHKIPADYGKEYRSDCCGAALEQLTCNGIFAINPHGLAAQKCFSYLHTAALHAAMREFSKQLRQRRADVDAWNISETYLPEEFSSQDSTLLVMGKAVNTRSKVLAERTAAKKKRDNPADDGED